MKNIKIDELNMYKDYLVIENKKIKVVFSTAEEGKNFNRHTKEGVNNLNKLNEEFNVENVVYLRQVHSNTVLSFNGENNKELIEAEGDALITDVKNSIIGVFTADCVPVILVDEELGAVAAIHSGWKGTFNSITKNTIRKMEEEFGVIPKNIKAYIGPHIRKCCYEVSEELKEKFIREKNIKESILFDGRNLSLEECILKDLRECGVKEENINCLGLCTHCSKKFKLFSYRASNGDYGRLFSFVLIK
ncbi:peptidoglycan editing factor PgeF [Clostridium sp. SHJSY1]|uniref:peptidoglycan editing factor PgeF n=1 Tax=Clostridium sp. SHJSY1 TaxID=2942483 RepID=UPI002875D9EE|nr:peptidoglycan editing factor PgeF [Clostridium sp. SHJSY1]MDS0524966.1 peptidoglycan editing factor PgeF [Clostridium sp. SHJSY1]